MKNINSKIGISQRLKTSVPFSINLNKWVEYEFNLLPFKVVFVDSEPYESFEQMFTDFEAMGVLYISTLHCENTIFGDPLVNQKFRAIHDFQHILHELDFSFESELIVNYHQNRIALQSGLLNKFDRELLNIETAGQIMYFRQYGIFPDDQRQFAINELNKTFKIR